MRLEDYTGQKFRFYCLPTRDEELFKGERKRLLKGVFTTERRDKHGEVLRISGMDFQPYLKKGRVNFDHLPGAQNVLGRPIDAKIVPDVSIFKKNLTGPGGYHIAELYDTEPGRAAWDLIKAEENDPNRQWGWSVQGAILEAQRNELIKTCVEDMALSPKPANDDTYVETSLEKAIFITEQPSLELQYIDDNQRKGVSSKESPALTGDFNLNELIWGDCKNECYDRTGKFRKGAQSLYLHLVKCKGMPEDDAFLFVDSLKRARFRW